jgi:hypothetical protein
MTREERWPKKLKTARADPHASMLIESMRDIGYSLESALADVVDNSITAGATTVRLFADTAGSEPRFAILDDGEGMTQAELLDAMRPGSRNPLDERNGTDLGRFGLGMKTASFSQCRRLTVVSKHNSRFAAASWDLDYVAHTDEWLVQIPDDADAIPWADQLGPNGTLVLWEKLDRPVDSESPTDAHQHLLRRLDDAIDHLELVFHRFLAGERGLKKISIVLNNRPLVAFDPFHSSHPATITGPVERISVRGHHVIVQTFTLPHHKKVTPSEWERYAGRAGYTRNQGFYLYRGKRLIIHGTWFGLARQMELTKLARVRIDMPNELDDAWKIDVRKSSAHPPRHVRERLRRIIEEIGAGSKRVYTARGRRLVSDSRVPVWQRVQDKNEIRYQINSAHPLVADFSKDLTEQQRKDLVSILELVGAALPIDALFADMGAQPERVSGTEMSNDTHEHALATTFRYLVATGLAVDDVVEMLRVTEPFRSTWSQTEPLVRLLIQETQSNA